MILHPSNDRRIMTHFHDEFLQAFLSDCCLLSMLYLLLSGSSGIFWRRCSNYVYPIISIIGGAILRYVPTFIANSLTLSYWFPLYTGMETCLLYKFCRVLLRQHRDSSLPRQTQVPVVSRCHAMWKYSVENSSGTFMTSYFCYLKVIVVSKNEFEG